MNSNSDANSGNPDKDDEICELEHLRKLFIGGLAPYTNEDSLRSFYEQWGKVVDVVVMRDIATKRSRGFGFITYTKAAAVDKAQENRPHIIDGKTVEAKRALPRPERETREQNVSVKKLFVGGLKDNHDEQCLKEYFSQFGEVVSVKILTDRTTGKRRGFAFIEYNDYDAVDKCILHKNHSIKYVTVDVKKSIYNQEGMPRPAAGKVMPGGMPAPPRQAGAPPRYGPPSNLYAYQPPAPQMNGAPPPAPGYNYWQQPPHAYPPQPYGYQQPAAGPPPNWGYPQAPPAWNGAAPPPAAPPVAPANSWGPPPQQWGPPPVPGAPPVAPPPNQWPAVAPPAVTPVPAAAAGPPPVAQAVPPPNFGTGYQQSYGGGPTKNANMSNLRMNPYAAQNQGYAAHSKPVGGSTYGGYAGAGAVGTSGAAPASNGAAGPKPVPPITNGVRRY